MTIGVGRWRGRRGKSWSGEEGEGERGKPHCPKQFSPIANTERERESKNLSFKDTPTFTSGGYDRNMPPPYIHLLHYQVPW